MANQKTNRRRLGQTAPPERPGHNSALVVAAGSAVRPSRSGQGLSRCGRSQEHRCILLAPVTEIPQTTENTNGRGSNGGVVAARKSDPKNGCATTLFASQRQMAVPTDEDARRREPMIGSTAIPRVEYGGESHCASPTTSGAFTLPKRCQRLLTPNCDWIMMWTYK